jgi:hypothetical protein
LWSKTPSGEIKYYTQNSDLSVYATTGSNSFNGNQTVTGSLTVTEGITGTATTASYVEYTGVANKPALVSSSAQIVEYNVFATTGSNQFDGSQAITGSLTVTGQVVAQTLNVQQVTSSIVFSSGSNIFGNSLSNTQQFTGSVSVTGSLTVNGAGTFTGNVAATGGTFINGNNQNTLGGGALSLLNYVGYNSSANQNITLGLGLNDAVDNNIAYQYILGVGGNASGQNLSLTSKRNNTTDLTILSINGTNGAATFGSSVTATSFSVGNGTLSNSGFWGTLITAGTGSFSNFALINASTEGIMYNTTGTLNMIFAGNVGIGTSTPNTIDTTAGARSGMESAIGSIGLNLTRGGENSVLVLQGGTYTNAKTAKIALLGGFGDGGGRTEGFTIESKASGTSGNITNSFIINSISSAGPSEQMRISSGGNVGIGSDNPPEKLTVLTSTNYAAAFNTFSIENTTTRISLGGLTVGAGGTGGTAAIGCAHHHSATAQSSLTFYTHNGDSLGEKMRINSGGNVLIDNTSDDSSGAKLQVNGRVSQADYTYYRNRVAGNLSGATWINTGLTLTANNLGTYEVYVLGNENNQNQCLRIYYVYYNTNIGWTSLLASTHIQPTGNEYGVVNLRMTSGGTIEVNAANSVSGGLYRIVVTKQFQN